MAEKLNRMPTPGEINRIGVGAQGEDLFLNVDAVPTPAPSGAGTLAPSGKMPGQPEFNEAEATPEEQAQYDQLVNKALDFMGQNPEQVLASMNNKEKPSYESVGELAVKIVKNIEGQAQAAQVQLSSEVLMNAGAEIIEHLMDLGDAGGIFPFKAGSEEYKQVLQMSMIHGARVAGEQLINSPQYTPEMKDEAGDIIARGVAGEVQRGESDPAFHENLAAQKVAADKSMIQGRQ